MTTPQPKTFALPLTWHQWRLHRPDTFTEFQLYGRTVLKSQYALYGLVDKTTQQENEVSGLQEALRTQLNPPNGAPDPQAPPPQGAVTASDALLAALVSVINAGLAVSAAPEKAQSKWSPLNKLVIKQRDDTDLLLSSAKGVIGWQAAWADSPIPVDVNAPEVNEEIRVLCGFILCSDTVVGVVVSEDEQGRNPAPYGEKAFASALVPDERPPGLRRTVECQTYGVMRSWHIDERGYFTGHLSEPVDGPRHTAYRDLNEREFAAGQGIAIAVTDVTNPKGRVLVRDKRLVPQGLTEFNLLFGTQGRLIFDYRAGDFYLSGHYQEYPVPDKVLTREQSQTNEAAKKQGKGLTCYPYFKLVDPHLIRLTWDGFVELGRLRHWENQRRARHSGTIGQ